MAISGDYKSNKTGASFSGAYLRIKSIDFVNSGSVTENVNVAAENEEPVYQEQSRNTGHVTIFCQVFSSKEISDKKLGEGSEIETISYSFPLADLSVDKNVVASAYVKLKDCCDVLTGKIDS